MPPQFAPPTEPGKSIVERRGTGKPFAIASSRVAKVRRIWLFMSPDEVLDVARRGRVYRPR